METRERVRVAIVGAAAAGTVTALRLLERAAGLELLLIDPAAGEGRGIAYATRDPRHLLNTPAGKMSAFAHDPLDFARWLGVGALDFVPRGWFSDYLAHRLAGVVRRTGANLLRVQARVDGLDPRPTGVAVRLVTGATVDVDAVVLAIGSLPPACDWAPPRLRGSARFIANPWVPFREPAGDVLLVGTGLTMVDLALSLCARDRVVHAVSRTGLLPHAHSDPPRAPAAPPALAGLTTLAQLRRALLRQVAATGGDWCAVIDGLRPVVPSVWAGLPPADRELFLRRYRRLWDVHRHRMPARTAAQVDRLRAAGRLVVHRGEIAGVTETPNALRVALSTRRELSVDLVVNCTGTHEDVGASHNPLLRELIANGWARPGPLGLGLDTSWDGRLLPAKAPLWTIGALRRGNLWETTAFPEIREQAGIVARRLLGARPAISPAA